MVLRVITAAMLAIALFVAAFVVGAQLSSVPSSGPAQVRAAGPAGGSALASGLSSHPTQMGSAPTLVSDAPRMLDPIVTITIAPASPTMSSPSPTPPTLAARQAEVHIADAFAPVAAELAASVEVPIRLPRVLPAADESLTPTLERADADGYTVHLGEGEGCTGRRSCRVATFTAQRRPTTAPDVSTGTPVPLPDGRAGWFVDSLCGGSCDNSFIVWNEGGVRYTVGTRRSSGQETLDLAWRAIGATVPSPSGPEVCGPGAPAHDGRVARTITTSLPDGRPMHWLVMCSDDGTRIEMIDQPGTVRWVTVRSGRPKFPVVHHDDGSTSLFTIAEGALRPVMDVATGRRLRIGQLACSPAHDGSVVLDGATEEVVQFLSDRAARRQPAESTAASGGCL